MRPTADEIINVIECITINLSAVRNKLTAEADNATPNLYKMSVWEKEVRHLKRALSKKKQELKEKRVMA